MRYCIENDYLTEDFFDNVSTDDIVNSEVDNDLENEINLDIFSHYVDFQFNVNFSYIGSVKGIDNIFKKYIYRQFEIFMYLKNYCVKYLRAEQDSNLSQTDEMMFDSISDMPYSKIGFSKYLMRVYFNPLKDNMGFVGILKLMLFFIKMNEELVNFHYMNFVKYVYIDGNYNFGYGMEEKISILNRVWKSKSAKKNIKHFVKIFNPSRKIQNELDNHFDEIDNFRGSGMTLYEFMSFFVNKEEDFKKCSIVVSQNSLPTVIIPENTEVHIYCIDKIPFYIEVRGTLVIHKTIYRTGNDNKTLFKKFTNFYHNNVRFDIDFDNSPYVLFRSSDEQNDKKINGEVIDLSGVKILNLDVVANDMYIGDVEELKEFVNFINDENVKNKNFEVVEI